MSSEIELDLATLHIDTNIRHTITQPNVKISSNSIDKLLKTSCSCTLREILFSSRLKTLDIRHYSIEDQIQLLTRLAFERFDSTCFADHDAIDTVCIKCFLNPDREICISRLSITQEDVLKFKSEINNIPVDLKLQLGCLVTDHQYIKDVLETTTSDLNKKNLLFYGISNKNILELLVKNKAEVNAKDARGRSPLFYAFTNSLNSARKLLDHGARVTFKDKCNVSVLTFFCENIMANRLAPCVNKAEGVTILLETKVIKHGQMIKEIINLIFCKFVQLVGTVCLTTNSRNCSLKPSVLCETLKCIFGERQTDEKIEALLNQLQSLQESIDADTQHKAVTPETINQVFDTLEKLGAKASSPDSDGNTCLHHATRLLFHGVPQETVMDVCHRLTKIGAQFNKTNHKNETPLLFCFSSKDLLDQEENSCPGHLKDICSFLLDNGSELRKTTHCKEESVFHLIIKLCQQVILSKDQGKKQYALLEMIDILKLFSANNQKKAVIKRDVNTNSPLHLWASLALTSHLDYQENVFSNYTFEDVLKQILDVLLECGARLDDSNDNDETPLHVCRTWAAVNLLLEAGANPGDKDKSGNNLLLAAAKNNTCLQKNSDRLYPDVSEEPKEFWKSVLDKKLDPWAADNVGESLLSILIKKEAFTLAESLLETACEQRYVQLNAIGIPLLIAICKDKSPDKHRKVDLVKILLRSRRSLVHGRLNSCKDTALHFSCRNVVNLPESTVQDSVHLNIVKHLLSYGADVKDAGEKGQSCLQIAESSATLKNHLITLVKRLEKPSKIDNWKKGSEKHRNRLSTVARKEEYLQVETIYFHPKYLDKNSDSFGFVFSGIDAEDGRELAIKRIDKLHRKSPESMVLSTRTCEQIVSYLFRREDPNFYYIAFELMEGTLEDLDMASCTGDNINLCKQVVSGLQCLHSQGIVHGSIHLRNVFYQSKPHLCLKIGNSKTTCQRSWVASEVLNSPTSATSSSSDMFSCGLVIHYFLSSKKHPFTPDDVSAKTSDEILRETEVNVLNNNIVQLDDSLSPEATHLVQLMLDSNARNRPSAAEALVHPLFWTNETKKEFLHVVGNQPEVAVKRKPYPLTAFEAELEGRFSTIVTKGSEWNSLPSYDKMLETYNGMKVKSYYNYGTVAHLIRFIRNAYEHNTEQPSHIQDLWEKDFVLKEPYFPHLVIEVYKALTKSEHHELHKSRKTIKKFFNKLN